MRRCGEEEERKLRRIKKNERYSKMARLREEGMDEINGERKRGGSGRWREEILQRVEGKGREN